MTTMNQPARSRQPRWQATFALLALCAGSLLATTVTATPAQARCSGANEVTMGLRDPSFGNALVAQEIPETGTCNGNNVYTGYVVDLFPDGWCARLNIYNPSHEFIKSVSDCFDGYGVPQLRQKFDHQRAGGMIFRLFTAPDVWVERDNGGY